MDILYAEIDMALFNLTLPSFSIVLGFIRIFCLYVPWGGGEFNELQRCIWFSTSDQNREEAWVKSKSEVNFIPGSEKPLAKPAAVYSGG